MGEVVSVWRKIASLLSSVGQEELAILRRQLEGQDGDMRRLQDETGFGITASSSSDLTERGRETSPITGITEDVSMHGV